MANEAAATVPQTSEVSEGLGQRHTEVLSRLFEHALLGSAAPLSGFICLRADFSHPDYPGIVWSPGHELEGHFVLSTTPLGTLSWLPPEDRLALHVMECAASPRSLIGGAHDTIETNRVLVTAELTKPLGQHSDSLQSFWNSLYPDPRGPDRRAAIELATEALLHFRLFGRFRCRGVSFVRVTVNRSGWSRTGYGYAANDWAGAWKAALAELTELRLRSLSDTDWQLVSAGIDRLVAQRLSSLPRPDLLREHILATSYALAAGPAAARTNPFAPLVRMGMMGLSALGMVGDWFWIAAPKPFAGYKHIINQSPF